MAKTQLTIAEVDQASAALADAKANGDRDSIKAASQRLNDLRQTFRSQEEAAGRRAPGAGVGVGPGDAQASPGTIDTGPQV